MKKLLYGFAALPFLAGVALADQPVQLSDNQMDKITQSSVGHAEETASAAEELNSQAALLGGIVAELQSLVDGGEGRGRSRRGSIPVRITGSAACASAGALVRLRSLCGLANLY